MNDENDPDYIFAMINLKESLTDGGSDVIAEALDNLIDVKFALVFEYLADKAEQKHKQ